MLYYESSNQVVQLHVPLQYELPSISCQCLLRICGRGQCVTVTCRK